MGKRQLGEMEPTEFIITILISNIATMPLERPDISLIYGLIPILSLITFEVIVSVIIIKFPKIKRALLGKAVVVIEDGKLNCKNLKDLRLSCEELLSQLRVLGIFDINTVEYAVMETNGSLSAMKKRGEEAITFNSLNINCQPAPKNYVIICDGKLDRYTLTAAGKNLPWLFDRLKTQELKISDTLLFTLCGDKCTVIKKE